MRASHIAGVIAVGLGAAWWAAEAQAIPYGGIDFPQGSSSFADSVIRYDPLFSGGPGPTSGNYMDPDKALGTPDYNGSTGSVSLGRGGLVELLFFDNLLTNSGSPALDLHVFEIGPDVEDTFVAIRPTAATSVLLSPMTPDPDGFFDIGKVFGSTDSLDIDAVFPGYGPGALEFDAVQLIDDFNEGASGGGTVGADIDAVGAITSAPGPGAIPEPLSMHLGLLGVGALVLAMRRRGT